MKKTYTLDEIDCANCASKLETAISKIDGVNFANINFFAQKLTVDIDDEQFDDVMKNVMKTAKRLEPDCKIEM